MGIIKAVMVVVCRCVGEGECDPMGWLGWCGRCGGGVEGVRGRVGMCSQLSYSTATPM